MFKGIGLCRVGIRSFVRFNSVKIPGKSTGPDLNWVEYFQLKKQNNRINIATSVFTGLAGAVITLNYLGNIEIDIEKPIIGFDPFMVMGGAVVLGGLLGYLLGPFLGTSVFNVFNKSKLHQYKVKEQLFLQRIKRNRVDPSRQSVSNLVPDYYGEKIYSINNYKQWLRDCNAFRRKATEFF